MKKSVDETLPTNGVNGILPSSLRL